MTRHEACRSRVYGPENFEIRYFHTSGQWVTFHAFANYSDRDEAIAQAKEFAQNTYAYPFGVRVTSRHGWKSETFGGHPCLRLTFDPVTEIWTVVCRTTGETVTNTDPHEVGGSARNHVCVPSANRSTNNIPGGFSHDDSVRTR